MKTAQEHYSEQVEKYDSYYEQPFFRVYKAVEMAFIRRFLPDGNKVIHDAAGATGLMSIPLAEEGHQIYLTDISSEMVAKTASKAYHKGLANFYPVVANIESLPFENSMFDLVTCLANPLSYCDYEKTLREFHRTMREGATLVATVENRLYLARECVWQASLETVNKAIDTGDVGFRFPMHGFTVQELSQVLEAAGFRVELMAVLPLLSGYKPDSEVDAAIASTEALDQLVNLELQYCEKQEWLEAGKNILFCCTKPSSS